MITHRLKHFLERNDGGCWGDDPTGSDDTIVLRSTEQSANGDWRIADPAVRHVSASEQKSKTIDLDDIIITKSSGSADHIGKASIADQSVAELEAVYSNFMQRIRVNRDVSPRYVWHLLNSYFARYHYNVYATSTSGLGNLNGTIVGNLPFPVSDFASQHKIADFLDRETARIDLLIEKKQQLVALLPEKEKNEISRLVLRGANPSVPFLDSGTFWRGKVPAHWSESRLKAQFKIQKRQGFDDLEVLSVYREYGVIEKSSRDDNINKTPEDLSKYQLVGPGDLVVNKMKAWQGSLGISTFTGITSPDYVVMTPCGKHYAQYMHHLLRAVPMPTIYHLISNGIRTDQWRLEPNRFLSLPVFLPPLEEQREIALRIDEELARLRNVAEAITASIDRLKEYRSALITAAVTGQIDVQTYTKSGTPDRRLDAIQEEMGA